MNRPIKVILLLCCLVPINVTNASAQENSIPESQQRLSSLCRLWGTLKYFHPYLAYRNIDWDSAFVAAVPLVCSAASSSEYMRALRAMTDVLGDPVTRVFSEGPTMANPYFKKSFYYELSADSILIFHIHNYSYLTNSFYAQRVFRAAASQLPKALGVVFDLRSPVPLTRSEHGSLNDVFSSSGMENKLAAGPVSSPGERRRLYSGFPNKTGSSSGGYWSSFVMTDGQPIVPDGSGFKHPVVFVVNQFAEIPKIALALRSSNQATIISEGTASDASVVTTHRFDAGEGINVEFRLGEIVSGDGSIGPQVHRVPAPDSGLGEEALRVSLAMARGTNLHEPDTQRTSVVAVTPRNNAYPAMRYPTVTYRLLAAARIWSVFNHFFPYSHLMETTWDSILSASLPDFVSARDSLEYGLAIAKMIARSHDTHVRAMNSPHVYLWGVGSPPFLVQFIEQKAVITHLLDSTSSLAAGIRIGDIVTSVDGEEVGTRLRRFTPYVSASTPQSLLSSLAGFIIRGPDSSIGTYGLQEANGKTKTIHVLRRAGNRSLLKSWRSGEIFKVLPGNIGYVDLERLSVSLVDSMFSAFRNTKAIIFDDRGYPMGTAWQIAPRLSEQSEPIAALFSRPVVAYPGGRSGQRAEQTEVYSFKQSIPATDKWRFKGSTVLLIDERAISQAEHTGLFLKAATAITFVGSGTTGANGDVTEFILPGGITVRMTGQNVRFPDGRQLQRIGLIPDIEVRPTIRGFLAGRDEILEKAIAYLNKKLSKK